MYILDVQTKGDCFGFAAAVVTTCHAYGVPTLLFLHSFAIDEDGGAIIASVDVLQGASSSSSSCTFIWTCLDYG